MYGKLENNICYKEFSIISISMIYKEIGITVIINNFITAFWSNDNQYCKYILLYRSINRGILKPKISSKGREKMGKV